MECIFFGDLCFDLREFLISYIDVKCQILWNDFVDLGLCFLVFCVFCFEVVFALGWVSSGFLDSVL